MNKVTNLTRLFFQVAVAEWPDSEQQLKGKLINTPFI